MALSQVHSSLEQQNPETTPPTPDRELWRGPRASLWAVRRLVRLHLVSEWRLLLAVGLGILVAVTLIASVPLYDALIGNVQLQALLNTELPQQRNVEIQIPSYELLAAGATQQDHIVRQEGNQYLGSFTQPAVTRYLSAEGMLLVKIENQVYSPGDAPSHVGQERNIIVFEAFDYAQTAPHMRLVAGRLPQPTANGPVEGMVTLQMTQLRGVKLGDVLTVAEPGHLGVQVSTRIVGIWSPTQVNDPYWNGLSFESRNDEHENYDQVLLDQSAFLQTFATIPDLEVRQHWIYYTRTRTITTDNMARVAQDVGSLRTQLVNDLGQQHTTNTEVLSALESNVHTEAQQLGLLTLPLYVIVAQIVGLALLFVVAMAGMLIEGERPQIAVLKSRGTSGAQLVASFALVGLLLAAVAALLGPRLAGGLSVVLVEAFVPGATLRAANVDGAYLAGLASPALAVVPVLAGAALGLGAVVLAVWRASRLDIVAFRRETGRPDRASFWRRYFVDVQIAVLCLAAYGDLSFFGGLGTREQLTYTAAGAASAANGSLVLLLAPGLLLLAGALLLLRVFPVAVAGGTRLAARLRGATGLLAFAQVGRNPTGPARLTLLLALAVGLGGFGLTVDGSLVRNAADRASYHVGADLRLTQNGPEPGVVDTRIQHQLLQLPGVEGITPVYRDEVFTTLDEGSSSVGLLAIDPASWAQVAGATSWRSDYATLPLDTLMADLRARQWGADAPDRAGQTQAGDPLHPLWAAVSQGFAQAQHVKVGDTFALEVAPGTGAASTLVVGAVIRQFPTMYDTQAVNGFIVVNLNDYFGAFITAFQNPTAQVGPNEYWLQSSSNPATDQTLSTDLANSGSQVDVAHVLDRRAELLAISGNSLQAGMRGLLLVGAVVAAALAVLGSIIQALLAARQRSLQFAVLRTLGLSGSHLVRMLLSEQVIVYVFGIIGGSLLAAALAVGTLPYLEFSDTVLDPATVGVPPYVLAISPLALASFYAALIVAFALALLLAAGLATRVGLGRALHIGED